MTTTIFMRRVISGLVPEQAVDAELLDKYAIGATVEVIVKQRRSPQHHRFFMATLSRLVEAGAVPFLTVDEFLDALKMACGITKVRRTIDGQIYIAADSISFAAMGEERFKPFKEAAFLAIKDRYGVDPEAVLQDVERGR